MTFILISLRDDADAKPVDDWIAWDLGRAVPAARGTRTEITKVWPTLRSGTWFHGDITADMFADAELTGTSSKLGFGSWGNTLHVDNFGRIGRLPRYNLRRYCDIVFTGKAKGEPLETIALKGEGLVIR